MRRGVVAVDHGDLLRDCPLVEVEVGGAIPEGASCRLSVVDRDLVVGRVGVLLML